MSDTVRRVLAGLPPYTGVAVLWVLLILWGTTTQDGFATSANAQNILQNTSTAFVLAIGVTFTVLLGGIDLSVGSLLALTGVVLAVAADSTSDPLALCAAVLFAVAVAGCTNGVLIGRFELNPFVVTLGGLSLFRGLAYLFSDGTTRTVSSPLIAEFGFGSFLGVSIPVLFMFFLLAVAWYVLRLTYFGRDVYAVGSNSEAARISGIDVRRVTFLVYLVSGLCVGLAMLLQTGRSGAAAPTAVLGIELQVAAAVLLGGTSLKGGSGSVIGTAVAVLFLGTVDNVLTLANVTSYWQQVITGSLLVAAVLIERLRSQRSLAAPRKHPEEPGAPANADPEAPLLVSRNP